MTTCRHSTQTSGMHFSDRSNIIFTTKWPFSKDMVQVLPHTSTKQRGVSLEATFGWRGWECEALVTLVFPLWNDSTNIFQGWGITERPLLPKNRDGSRVFVKLPGKNMDVDCFRYAGAKLVCCTQDGNVQPLNHYKSSAISSLANFGSKLVLETGSNDIEHQYDTVLHSVYTHGEHTMSSGWCASVELYPTLRILLVHSCLPTGPWRFFSNKWQRIQSQKGMIGG